MDLFNASGTLSSFLRAFAIAATWCLVFTVPGWAGLFFAAAFVTFTCCGFAGPGVPAGRTCGGTGFDCGPAVCATGVPVVTGEAK